MNEYEFSYYIKIIHVFIYTSFLYIQSKILKHLYHYSPNICFIFPFFSKHHILLDKKYIMYGSRAWLTLLQDMQKEISIVHSVKHLLEGDLISYWIRVIVHSKFNESWYFIGLPVTLILSSSVSVRYS